MTDLNGKTALVTGLTSGIGKATAIAPAARAARRYLRASEFGTDVSGQFFASAQRKFSGPIEVQRHPHLHDRANRGAAWQAVVNVSGVVLSSPSSLNVRPEGAIMLAVAAFNLLGDGLQDNLDPRISRR